jgi:hypothetical protein
LQVISDDKNNNNNNSRREKLAISRQTTPVDFAFMSVRSPTTKKQYPRRLKRFFDYLSLEGNTVEEQAKIFLARAKIEPEFWVEDSILSYLDHNKERVLVTKEIEAGTLLNLYQPIVIFCKRHKHSLPTTIDWDMISESLPQAKRAANDRSPTTEEIKKLVEYPDRAIKPIVYTMCSSGIRLGAWDYLRWKHVIPKTNEKTGEIIAAKLIVYAGEYDEYFSFITPEAYNSLKRVDGWM